MERPSRTQQHYSKNTESSKAQASRRLENNTNINTGSRHSIPPNLNQIQQNTKEVSMPFSYSPCLPPNPLIPHSPKTWPNTPPDNPEGNTRSRVWLDQEPKNTKHHTHLHKILASTSPLIQPQSQIEEIDNAAYTPWHQNILDLYIHQCTKAQATSQPIINTISDILNSRMLKFY